MDAAEMAILEGATDLQKHVISNRYGHEVSWLLPYLYDEGSSSAIIGVDYSINSEQQNTLRNFLIDIVPIVLALGMGFLVQLAILRRRITGPIHKISKACAALP